MQRPVSTMNAPEYVGHVRRCPRRAPRLLQCKLMAAAFCRPKVGSDFAAHLFLRRTFRRLRVRCGGSWVQPDGWPSCPMLPSDWGWPFPSWGAQRHTHPPLCSAARVSHGGALRASFELWLHTSFSLLQSPRSSHGTHCAHFASDGTGHGGPAPTYNLSGPMPRLLRARPPPPRDDWKA